MSRMQLQSLPITQLKPAPYNPRLTLKPGTPAWDKLKRSLDEFDLVQPIVWNRQTGHVVGGHQRLEILKDRGDTEVDCIVVDLSLEREKALNITLNNSQVGSDWDAGKLASLLDELQDLPDFDATLTGFDDQQIQDMLFQPDPIAFPGLAEDSGTVDDTVRVTLDVAEEAWERVEEFLNELLASESEVRMHVRLPHHS